MGWLPVNRGVATVVGLTLALPVALLLYVVFKIAALGIGYQGEIASLEPRIARLLGSMQVEQQLVDAAGRAGSSIENLVYPSGEDQDTVTATLQTEVRGILSDAGLVVADSQIERARREGAFDVIGLTVSVTGDIENLNSALSEIVAYQPLLLVTDISVTPTWTARRRDVGPADQQHLAVKMSLQAVVGVE